MSDSQAYRRALIHAADLRRALNEYGGKAPDWYRERYDQCLRLITSAWQKDYVTVSADIARVYEQRYNSTTN